MINNGKFFVVTSDLLSLSFFSSFKKDGVSIDIVPNFDAAKTMLESVKDLQSVMLLVDITSNEDKVFDDLRSFVSIFPPKQIVCFTESVEMEHIRKTKELSIPSVVTKNDFQKLFSLLTNQYYEKIT